jgi:quinol monooxygenase YgiN
MMYATMRRFGADEAQGVGDLLGRARDAVAPALLGRRGFRFYCVFADEGGGVVSLAVFEDADAGEAAAAEEAAQGGEVASGEVHHHDDAPDLGRGGVAALFVVVREYAGVAPAEEALPLVREHLLPAVRGQPGFAGFYAFRDEADPARHVSVSLWRSRDAAMVAHQRALGIAAGPLRGVFPDPPRVAAGPSYILIAA